MTTSNWSPPVGEPQRIETSVLSDPRSDSSIDAGQNGWGRDAHSRIAGLAVPAIAVIGGIVGALSGVSPTGARVTDAIVTAVVAAVVAWAGSTAPWWLLVVIGGIAAACSDLRLWSAVGFVGAGIGLVVGWKSAGWKKPSVQALSAASAACSVQTMLHLRVNQFLGCSAIIAAMLGLAILIGGIDCKRSIVRLRMRRIAMIVFGLALVSSVAFGISAVFAKDRLTFGYNQLIVGLRQLRSGDTAQAADTFRKAAVELDDANSIVGGPWTQPARLVPFVAQHRNAVTGIVNDAAASANAAADALAVIRVDQLRVVNGQIDVSAIAALADPMRKLSVAVQQMSSTLDNSDSPWLFAPFQDRLDVARGKLNSAKLQTLAGQSAAAYGPAMLGANGPRKYLVAFTSAGEARGQSGLVGNWAELTIDNGRLSETGFGRTSKLIDGIRSSPPFALVADTDFLDRYAPYGARDGNGNVTDKFWSNVTMSPDTPSVGAAMAQMYAQGGLGQLDGVFILDTNGLAALLKVTGPIKVDGIEQPFTADTLQDFLLFDQYKEAEDVRRDQLEAIAKATVTEFLSADLPVPEKLAHELGPATTEGHIVGWAKRPEEQELLVRIGMSGRLPQPDGRDGLAVVNNNASGNKIDSFLERSQTYTARYDEGSGVVSGELTVTLNNAAPPDGFPDYVIGSLVGLPKGTNRSLLTIYSPLNASAMTLDGQQVSFTSGTERGWNTFTFSLDLGPGEVKTIAVQLEGKIGKGKYVMVYRPQPLSRADGIALSVRSSNGETVAVVSGEVKRLSEISIDGVVAIR